MARDIHTLQYLLLNFIFHKENHFPSIHRIVKKIVTNSGIDPGFKCLANITHVKREAKRFNVTQRLT